MKDSKINNDQKPLSEEEIKNAENFEEVLQQFNATKSGFFNKYWHFITAGVILLIAGLMFKDSGESGEKVNETESFAIVAPIDNVDIPLEKHTIDASNGGSISLKSGTMIKWPEGAFIDSIGNPIQGNADIYFREIHDVASIYASGIPMTYDSANTQYHFESAGMFEIKGMQNNQTIFINPEKPLVVELASKQSGGYFNLYSLDKKGKWNFIEKDTAGGLASPDTTSFNSEKIQQLNNNLSKAEKQLKKAKKKLSRSIQKNIGYQPIKANDDLYSINLEYDKNEFPELAAFKDILFEVTENNDNFTPDLARKDWDEIKIKKLTNGDYQLIMFDEFKKHKFEVRPVINDDKMSNANVTFDKLFSEYDNKLNGKLSSLKEERDSLMTVYKSISDSVNNLNNAFSAIGLRNDSISQSTQNIQRVFTIDNFGIFNSDCPQNLPKGALFQPVFVNDSNLNDTLSFGHLYMAELHKNALYSLYGYWGKPQQKENQEKYTSEQISYNPYHKTVIWGITSDNRFALIHPKNMGQLKVGGNIDVKMKVIEEKIEDIDKIRKLLGLT